MSSASEEDRMKVAELGFLKQELVSSNSAGEAKRIAEQLMMKTLEHGSDNPDPICNKIEQELNQNPSQYPNLLDVWDGNSRKASEMVRDHMIELGKLGKQWSMRRSMAHLDELAARVTHR